jgi:hypothetical protein
MVNKTIKGIDPELWKEARVQAILAGTTLGEWLNKLIRKALGKKEG